MAMGIALQLLFTGLGIGSIYALVALGFVLIYRATNSSKGISKALSCITPGEGQKMLRELVSNIPAPEDRHPYRNLPPCKR
jgi:hypothetical protein